jgi:hypothetical protein
MTTVLRVREEADRARSGVLERSDAVNDRIGIAPQLAAEAHGQVGEPRWH